MPYTAAHRLQTKKRIIDSARKLFNCHGFESVSIGQIMAGAGLTHGGFYSYFGSKSDLYAEVMNCFFTDPEWKNCWEGVHVDLSSTDVGAQVVKAYLSRQHHDDVENSCPMVALPTDVARSGEPARRAFETVFRAMVSVLERSMTNKNGASRSTAQAIAALSIGGMVVARTLVDRSHADELRASCIAAALELGGWDSESKVQRKAQSGRDHRGRGRPAAVRRLQAVGHRLQGGPGQTTCCSSSCHAPSPRTRCGAASPPSPTCRGTRRTNSAACSADRSRRAGRKRCSCHYPSYPFPSSASASVFTLLPSKDTMTSIFFFSAVSIVTSSFAGVLLLALDLVDLHDFLDGPAAYFALTALVTTSATSWALTSFSISMPVSAWELSGRLRGSAGWITCGRRFRLRGRCIGFIRNGN